MKTARYTLEIPYPPEKPDGCGEIHYDIEYHARGTGASTLEYALRLMVRYGTDHGILRAVCRKNNMHSECCFDFKTGKWGAWE